MKNEHSLGLAAAALSNPNALKNENVLVKALRQQYQKDWYERNKEQHKANAHKNKERTMAENQRKVFEYLLEHPCVTCGQTNPVVLDFDHDEPKTKREAVSVLVCQGFSWETVEAEIKKCTVRCKNCHAYKTAKEQKHARFILWKNWCAQ